jgi:hypothetical protein
LLSELAQTASAPEIQQVGSALTVKLAAVEIATQNVLLN